MSLSVLSVGLLFILGLALGSFGSVLVTRVPKGKSIGGRSKCPGCKTQIQNRDLIPVVSYLLLCGKCRNCKRKISLRYPLLELGSAAVIVLPSIHEGYIDPFTITLGLTLWIFLLLAVIDHDSQGIPDALTLPLIALAFLASTLRGNLLWEGPILGGVFFGVQWLLSRGRVLGSGDILIGIAMGFILGSWLPTLIGIGLSYIIGAIAAGTLLITGKYHQKSRIAFVPYLFAGTVVTLGLGDRLIRLVIF